MIWLFELSVGLLIAAALMAPLYKLFAPAWAGSRFQRARHTPPKP